MYECVYKNEPVFVVYRSSTDHPKELYHHGVKGMKWGVRRYQNAYINSKSHRSDKNHDNTQFNKKKGLSDKQKKALKIGAVAASIALTAYGTYKVGKMVADKKTINAGKRFLEQQAYLQKNISNIQSHVDPAQSLYKSPRWKSAYNATLRSRQSSIRGDRALYDDKTKRDAHKETIQYMYDALRRGDFDKYINGQLDPYDWDL